MINSVVLAESAMAAVGIGMRHSARCIETEIVAATGLLSKRKGDRSGSYHAASPSPSLIDV